MEQSRNAVLKLLSVPLCLFHCLRYIQTFNPFALNVNTGQTNQIGSFAEADGLPRPDRVPMILKEPGKLQFTRSAFALL